jgi:hypothetical protein
LQCDTAGSKQGQLAAYAKQPPLTCKVFELALRANNSADASSFAADVLSSIAKLCLDAPATAAADQEQLRQAFALSLSCLKLAAAQCSEGQLQPHQQKAIGVVAYAAVLTAEGLERSAQKQQHTHGSTEGDSSGSSSGDDSVSGSSGSEGDSDSDSDDSSNSSRSRYGGSLPAGISRMLVMLVARGLLLAARPELRTGAEPTAAAAAAAASDATAAGSSSATAVPQITAAAAALLRNQIRSGVDWLERVLPAVELPGGAASEPAKQQLLQLQGRLQQDFQDSRQLLRLTYARRLTYKERTQAVERAAERQVDAAAAAALDTLADQAQALGEALCAQLPQAHCCNNPGCVELRGASELQLVGGKGCVCSRCR